MRDILFKNLTSADRKKRMISSSETVDKQGVRSIIRRHFICKVEEIKHKKISRPVSHIYVFKERNTKEKKEKFLCRIKGSLYLLSNGRLFLVLFVHSLQIHLAALPKDAVKYSEEG